MSDSKDDKRPFAIQEDDKEIISHLYRYRYLQTRQLHDLLPHRKPTAIRRRLRKMVSNGWVACLERSQSSGLTNNHAYTLGLHGLQWIAGNLGCGAEDLPFSKKAAKIGPVYLDHAIMVNDARVMVDRSLALPVNEDVVMTRWIAEYDLRHPRVHKEEKQRAKVVGEESNKKRHFILYEKFPRDDRVFFFKPDAAFFAYRRGGDSSKQMMFCLEADRGTETVNSTIRQKVIGYNLFHSEARYAPFENFGGFRVLFILQAPTERRIHGIRAKLIDVRGVERLRFALQKELTPENFFKEAIWYDADGKRVSLISSK